MRKPLFILARDVAVLNWRKCQPGDLQMQSARGIVRFAVTR